MSGVIRRYPVTEETVLAAIADGWKHASTVREIVLRHRWPGEGQRSWMKRFDELHHTVRRVLHQMALRGVVTESSEQRGFEVLPVWRRV